MLVLAPTTPLLLNSSRIKHNHSLIQPQHLLTHLRQHHSQIDLLNLLQVDTHRRTLHHQDMVHHLHKVLHTMLLLMEIMAHQLVLHQDQRHLLVSSILHLDSPIHILQPLSHHILILHHNQAALHLRCPRLHLLKAHIHKTLRTTPLLLGLTLLTPINKVIHLHNIHRRPIHTPELQHRVRHPQVPNHTLGMDFSHLLSSSM